MITLTLLVCSNGFGHFKRCARISERLVSVNKKININFICKNEIISRQADWSTTQKIVRHPRINFFDAGTTVEITKPSKSSPSSFSIGNIDWLDEELIINSDIVISDNVSSILKIRQDSILMGSFLWADVISKYKNTSEALKNYYESEMLLLKTYNPTMITLRDMAMPFVKENTNPFYTSWIADNKKLGLAKKVKEKIQNILIIGGGTGVVDSQILKIIKNLKQCKKYKIFSSKSVIGNNKNISNVTNFDFNCSSFSDIDLLICRPGIGSLTDAVTYNIPVFGIAEEGNSEIQFNLNQIEELNFGFNISNDSENIIDLIESIQLNGKYLDFQESLKKANKNGLEEIIGFLNNKIKN